MKMLFIFTLSEHAPRARALLDVLTRKVEETLMEAQSGSVWTFWPRKYWWIFLVRKRQRN
jgi:hypothetical protein